MNGNKIGKAIVSNKFKTNNIKNDVLLDKKEYIEAILITSDDEILTTSDDEILTCLVVKPKK